MRSAKKSILRRLEWWENRILAHTIPGDYFEAEGINRSRLCKCFKSMAHYWAESEEKQVTDAMAFGTIFDKFVLDSPNQFNKEYALFEMPHSAGEKFQRINLYKNKPVGWKRKYQGKSPILKPIDHVKGHEYNTEGYNWAVVTTEVSRGMTTKENKEAYERWKWSNKGKSPLTEEELETLRKMRSAYFLKPKETKTFYPEMFFRGTVINRLPLTATINGQVLKIELDKLKITWTDSGLVLWPADIKAVEDASEGGFKKGCKQWHWDVQDSFYCKVLESIFPKPCKVMPMTFLLAEKKSPFLAAAYTIKQTDRDLVRIWIDETLDRIAQGDKTGYPTGENGVKNVSINLFKYQF